MNSGCSPKNLDRLGSVAQSKNEQTDRPARRRVKLSRSEHLHDLMVLLPSFRGRDSRLTLQETLYILKRCTRMPFNIVCQRIFARRGRSQTYATKIMIRSEKVLPGSFVKLKIYIQRDRNVVSILQPMGSVYRTMNANSGPQMINNRTRLELRLVSGGKIVPHPI